MPVVIELTNTLREMLILSRLLQQLFNYKESSYLAWPDNDAMMLAHASLPRGRKK
ncbi:hypothetical protein SAMN05216522_10253 [Rosenbergiella nectarea]|uniref:Uncharacterized protein n=1 Tax=Rosenbergiella nectarea TaxID=988801 RepID=A0A1H9ETH4_9GAMM|nr:hypothetical protein SAMN05216522_10253 [Rosenbergiella nectarea]